MALEIRLLGRVDMLVDGRALPLGGSKQRAVLAMLALRANRLLTTDELIDGLWGARPPPSATKNVQLYVSRLRKALGSNGSGTRIVTRGRGYELQVPDDAVDARRFERLVERARREADHGIIGGAAEEAIELWRGPPLVVVASEPFAGPAIRWLEELHLRAVELAIDAELAAGGHDAAVGRLEALVSEHPLDERFHAKRMLALYRAGRQSEALDAYREARRALVSEIGVEPGADLRALERAILNQDPVLDAAPPPEELPPQLEGGSPVVAGRERELRWLRRRWQEAEPGRPGIALIHGPAGIGKTRLAAELAAEVRRTGAEVVYAAGSGAPNAALETVRATAEGGRPALVVIDDADDASPALLDAATALTERHPPEPLLVLALHRDDQGPPALAGLARAGKAQRLALRPLSVEAAAEIAALYAPADGVEMPIETLLTESEGVPLRIHRAASEWAQAEAAERLVATVSRAAGERGGLRAVETEVAGSVVDLEAARERTRLYLVTEPPDSSTADICPYRGLAPFDAAHAEYFFGRERLVAHLVARLVGSSLLAVIGPSGSGKSSLLRAGLLPALATGVLPGSERWHQVVMRPGAEPLAELRRAIARVAHGAPEADGADPVAAALEELPPGARLVVAVDQFEEIFTACRDEAERAAFAESLAAAAEDRDRRVIVLVAIRADFYGRCAAYPELAAQTSANNVLVGPMRREELRRAVELPARKAGLQVEPRLATALVGDVTDEPGGLPLLSTTLVEIWEERRGRTLVEAAYEASGGVAGAVARHAERTFRRLTERQREAVRAILLRLADAEQATPVRRRVPLAELDLERDPDRAAALAALIERRLATIDEGTVEVAHEALLREWPRLRAWLADDAEGRRLHQHLIGAAAEWRRSGREPTELYRGARLASALDWSAVHDPELNELEREFLDASRASAEHEAERQRRANRRLRTLLAGVGVLLALAVIAGAIARSERQSARSAATIADAERLGAQAQSEDRLGEALRLAGAGFALADSVTTRSNLLSTLLRGPAAVGVLRGDGDPISALALSPDGDTLAVGDRDGTLLLFDTETRELIGDHEAPGPGTAWVLSFDPQGDSLARTTNTNPERDASSLQILDAGTTRLRESVSLGGYPADPGLGHYTVVAYAPDGRSLIVTYSRGDLQPAAPLFVRRYDARTGEPRGKAVRIAPRSVTTPPLMSADGYLLASTDEATYAVDAKTLRVTRRYPVGGVSTAVSPDGATLAVEDAEGALRLLDLASGRVRTLAARQDASLGIGAFSPDAKTLSTWDDADNAVILWDVEHGVVTESLEGHSAVAPAHTFAADGRTLYTAGEDGSVLLWDVAGDRRLGRAFPTGFVNDALEDFPPPFAISPDGRTLAVARLDGRVELIDAENLRRTGVFAAFPDKQALAIDYSRDGRSLAVAGESGRIGIWDARSGRRIGPLLRAPRGPRLMNPHTVQAVAFGRGGILAAAELGGTVRIWDLARREQVRPPLRLDKFVLGLAFSPDGSQLAIPFGALGEDSHGVEVRDVAGGERVASLPSDGEVRSVAFSPDGRLLAGGGVDGSTYVWGTDGWNQVGSPLALSEAMTLAVTFSPDGRMLATSHTDGRVVLWDVDSREQVGSPLPGMAAAWMNDTWVTSRFSPDGRRLFAVSAVGRAVRWEVDPAVWRAHACAVAGELTPEQWAEVVPEQDHVSVCPAG